MKSNRYVHCQCLRCNGTATTRSTELRHWSETRLCVARASGTFGLGSSDASDQSDTETTAMDIEWEENDSQEAPETPTSGMHYDPESPIRMEGNSDVENGSGEGSE